MRSRKLVVTLSLLLVCGCIRQAKTGSARGATAEVSAARILNADQDSGGWQLNLASAPEVTPPLVPCSTAPPPGLPCFSNAADVATFILTTGQLPNEFITGNCNPAGGEFTCFAGAGGMDRHRSKVPYATQASLEIDREFRSQNRVMSHASHVLPPVQRILTA